VNKDEEVSLQEKEDWRTWGNIIHQLMLRVDMLEEENRDHKRVIVDLVNTSHRVGNHLKVVLGVMNRENEE
jgi:hypothetical protein|tara:strand:+ start:222 stop:434 length:213 start_codon:yes stop_codon:yes gene_type:complete